MFLFRKHITMNLFYRNKMSQQRRIDVWKIAKNLKTKYPCLLIENRWLNYDSSMQRNVMQLLRKWVWATYIAWEDVHEKKQVCRVLRMMYFYHFLKGQIPYMWIYVCVSLVNSWRDTHQALTLVFSCGFGGSRAGKKSIYFSTNHFCVDWLASVSTL